MKQSLLTALSAVLAKSAILRPVFGDHLRNGLARFSKSVWLALNPRTSIEVFQLFTSPELRPVLRREPRLMFKFLRDYLATDLSRGERASLLLHHYRFLKERFDDRFFETIVDNRLELCQLVASGCVHRIRLWIPRTPFGEGDLTLTFEVDNIDLYSLSFTIGPGAIAGLPARDAMYIARVQGKSKRLDRIREATKSCYDVSPAAVLLAAAEGLAEALELREMVGIGASTHVARKHEELEKLVKAYDDFWAAMGASRLDRNMYRLSVPTVSKPISSIKRDHRSRTRRKRRFKSAIKDGVRESFRAATKRGGALASPAVPAIPVRVSADET